MLPLSHLSPLAGRDRSAALNRRLGYMLAFVAGAANAGGFLAVHQYTSHMTGMVASMSDGIVMGLSDVVLNAFGALLFFVAGAAVCSALVNIARRHQLHSAYALTLLLEAVLLMLFGLLGSQLSLLPGVLVPVTVMVLAFTMGLQNAVITKVTQSDIRTTHVTGVVTDIGIELGRLLYWNTRLSPSDTSTRPDWGKLRMLSMLLLGFFIGGLAGAYGFKHMGYRFTLLLSAGLVALVIVPVSQDLWVCHQRMRKHH